MFLRFLVLWFFPFTTWAQVVQITEIAPHTLAHQPEWFEFYVENAEKLDMSFWQLSNGQNKPKAFSENLEQLHTQQEGYFYFSPSPLSLPNGGGTIQILDQEGNILSAVSYPETKTRSSKNYEQREIWNFDPGFKGLLPQLVRAPEQPDYNHTRGYPNKVLPTHPDLYKIEINEFSPDSSIFDFIEIFVKDGPDKINLQYLTLKHNGTVLWHFKAPFFISPGDYLIFKIGTPDHGKSSTNTFHSNNRNGLSSGSGTLELIAMSDTSLEKRVDSVCWKNQTLSQTEQNRVEKFIAGNSWSGPCFEVKDLIKNESIARIPNTHDSNTAKEWFRHFNGSAGDENKTINQSPQAVIEIQGSQKTVDTVPFYLNPTGENSHDPDGLEDLKSYEWTLNQEVISLEKNPPGFYIETIGEFNLTLTLTDQSGAQNTTSQIIVGLEPGKRSTSNGTIKAQKAVIENILQQSAQGKSQVKNDDFFDFYLSKSDWIEVLQKPLNPYPNYESEAQKIKTKPYVTYDENWKRKINLPEVVRARTKKNLGTLFSWRAAPWPDLAAEWTAVVAGDQTFGYFGGVYLGF